jgi:hypothetical protein
MITEIKFTPEEIKAIYAERRSLDEPLGVLGKVLAIIKKPNGDEIHIEGINIIGDEGDKYYAQCAAGETPTIDFKGTNAGLLLGTGTGTPTKSDTSVTTVISGSGKTRKSGYPKTNDTGDADNTGDGVDIETWTYEYATGEANNGAIAEGAIVNNTTTPTAALTHFKFSAAFPKTSADTLKVIINHQFNGI